MPAMNKPLQNNDSVGTNKRNPLIPISVSKPLPFNVGARKFYHFIQPLFIGVRQRAVGKAVRLAEWSRGDRTPPHASVPDAITATEQVGWAWDKSRGDIVAGSKFQNPRTVILRPLSTNDSPCWLGWCMLNPSGTNVGVV
ncbi:hypothetical protein AVEN_146625-1 [Araneus ventricosus]|uniref:Uncharacterized protein n=1 Tax=Araneus ventricosus TaxID=182803 RepID=A0A4Y2F030_ARAVE|nr:hypothetical protein AVEN_146625-1 [Araneus ventricosus]